MKVTYKYRVKDKHSASLNKMARAVNYVWNYSNDLQKHALKWNQKWPTKMGITYQLAGASKYLCISANTINAVGQKYVVSRQKRPFLRYRGKKSLGWVPIRGADIWTMDDGFRFFGKTYSVWLSRRVPKGAKILDGTCFSQDARGRWFLNVVLEIPEAANDATGIVGIDLGLKDLATLSTGEKIAAPQHYRRTQNRLATAQRARKKRQIKKIHDRIANQRKDHLHKITTNIVRQNNVIIVGNVNASGLAKTRMAKSVLDAGWSSLRNMLQYKSIANGGRYIEADEGFTTQACSDCGSISGPKGRESLCVREWQCDCGSIHDRDHNSALNILRIGQDTLTGTAH